MRKDSSQPHRAGTGRTRRPRGSLTPAAILDAAEAVAANGLDALTMRAVAARLSAVPMALYNHLATNEQPVDALLDRALGRFEPQPHTDDRAEDPRRFARAHRRPLATHPRAVAPLFSQPNPGISSVRIGEFGLGILRRGRLPDARAVAALSGIIALNHGWPSFTTARDLDPQAPATTPARCSPRCHAPNTRSPPTSPSEIGAYGSDHHYDQRTAIARRGRRVAFAVDEPCSQRGSGGAVEWNDAAAVALAMSDDQLAGAPGQARVAGVQVGEFADSQSGAQQQFHDRPVAARAQAIGFALHGAQLLG
jgi:AcrR family transcriptional regulator